MGKNKPTYSPHLDHGDNVVVINAKQVVFTGKKYEKKLYRWHTGYPGGFRETTPKFIVESKERPERIIQSAVKGMLPRNKLRDKRLHRLKIFSDDQHPYDSYFGKIK